MADERDQPTATRAVGRRTLLIGAVVAAGGAAVVGGPRVVRRLQRSHLGVDVPIPSGAVPVRDLSFDSVARGRRVQCLLSAPADLPGDAPMVVWLHGRGDSARSVTSALRVPAFLGAAIRNGAPPFGVVSVDGGNNYWHRRRNGDDPAAMVLDEVPRILAAAGHTPRAWGIAGWSMGGYGALLLAERSLAFTAVAVASAAVWFHPGDSRPGAFDDREDFDAHDVLAGLGRLPKFVRVDCGTSDPFASTNSHLLHHVPGAAGTMAEGAHTMRFWRSVLPAQLDFFAAAFAAR